MCFPCLGFIQIIFHINFILNKNVLISAVTISKGNKSSCVLGCLLLTFKKIINTKLGNSNWATTGKITLTSNPVGLIITLVSNNKLKYNFKNDFVAQDLELKLLHWLAQTEKFSRLNDVRVEVEKNLQTTKEMENVLTSLTNNELEGPDKLKTGLNYNLGVF